MDPMKIDTDRDGNTASPVIVITSEERHVRRSSRVVTQLIIGESGQKLGKRMC